MASSKPSSLEFLNDTLLELKELMQTGLKWGDTTLQGTQRYYVVHFVKENTVEVVPEQWVEKSDGVLCCYWPRNASATMIKRGDRPNKILWEKYRISIISSTDNYSVAEQRAKRGVDTSNVESDEEPAKRAVTKPIRFHVEPPDDDGSEALQKKTNEPRQAQLTVPQLPPAPSDQELPSLLDEPVASEMPAGYIKDEDNVETVDDPYKTALNQVMEAVEARQPKESESLGQLEMLQNPAETNEELKDICETLKDSHYRKKMIRYPTLCCGLDLGSGIRRMMKIGAEE
ncbi:unnamed protein product, partial [Coregonus sp. 'balchen']